MPPGSSSTVLSAPDGPDSTISHWVSTPRTLRRPSVPVMTHLTHTFWTWAATSVDDPVARAAALRRRGYVATGQCGQCGLARGEVPVQRFSLRRQIQASRRLHPLQPGGGELVLLDRDRAGNFGLGHLNVPPKLRPAPCGLEGRGVR